MISKKQLQAQNCANKLINEIVPLVSDLLKSNVGEKIVKKSDNYYTKKFNQLLDNVFAKFPNNSDLDGFDFGYAKIHRISLNYLGSSLVLSVTCRFEFDKNSCFYRDADIYVGSIGRDSSWEYTGVLDSVYEDLSLMPIYDFDEQVKLANEVIELENKLGSLKRKLMVV